MFSPGSCAVDQAGSSRSLGARGPQDPGAGQAARGTGANGMKDAQRGCGATCGREGPGQVRSPSAAPSESRPTSPGGRPGAWEGPQPHSPRRDPGSIVLKPAPQRAARQKPPPARHREATPPSRPGGWIGERCGQWWADRSGQRRRCGGGALRRRRYLLRPPPPPRWGPGDLCSQTPWVTTCSLTFTWVLRASDTGCLPTCMSSDTVQGWAFTQAWEDYSPVISWH